jgi:hypothetical protein
MRCADRAKAATGTTGAVPPPFTEYERPVQGNREKAVVAPKARWLLRLGKVYGGHPANLAAQRESVESSGDGDGTLRDLPDVRRREAELKEVVLEKGLGDAGVSVPLSSYSHLKALLSLGKNVQICGSSGLSLDSVALHTRLLPYLVSTVRKGGLRGNLKPYL